MKVPLIVVAAVLAGACASSPDGVTTEPSQPGKAGAGTERSEQKATLEAEVASPEMDGAIASFAILRKHRPPVCSPGQVYFALACRTPAQARVAREQLSHTSSEAGGLASAWAKYATTPLDSGSDEALLTSVRAKADALVRFKQLVDVKLSSASPGERGCLLERRGDGFLDFAASVSNLPVPPGLTAAQAELLRKKLRDSAASVERKALVDYDTAVNSDRTGPRTCWKSALSKSFNTIFRPPVSDSPVEP